MNTRFLTLVTIVFVLLAGCSPAATPTAPPPLPTATATLAPTSTPTPPPSATPTATPNATATQAALATAQAEEQSAQVKSELEALGIPVDTGSLAYLQAGSQSIEIPGGNQALVDVWADGDGLSASDFVLSTDITWDTPGLATCGVVFRAEGDDLIAGGEYLFQILRLSGLPAWDIEYLEDGFFGNSPAGETSSDIDQANGATNHIDLVAEGEKFTLYINGVKQGSYYDYSKQRLDGGFGFYAWQESGNTTCTFENTAVWVYE